MKKTILLSLFFLPTLALSSEGFKNESELGITINNSRPYASSAKDSTSVSAKQTTSYGWEKNILVFKANYLTTSTNTNGVSSISNNIWLLGLRYERELNAALSGFAEYSAEGDITKNYQRKNNADLGLKYYFSKSQPTTWFIEAGYRNTDTLLTTDDTFNQSAARLYSELVQELTQTASGKLTVEFIQNLTKPDLSGTPAVRAGSKLAVEPSLSVKLSDLLSMKTAFTFTDEEVANNSNSKQGSTTRTLTTSLLAKF